MKFTNTSLAALIASSLIGCVPADDNAEFDSYVRQEAAKLATQKQELDKRELELALREAKLKDPTIKDMYYSVDDRGERQLNVVHQSADNNDGMETFTYALMGAAAGMFMSNMMMNSSGPSYYRQRAASHYVGSVADTERRKRSYAGAYVINTNSRITNNVYSKARAGSFTSSTGRSISTSRPAFSSSGARSGSVGG